MASVIFPENLNPGFTSCPHLEASHHDECHRELLIKSARYVLATCEGSAYPQPHTHEQQDYRGEVTPGS